MRKGLSRDRAAVISTLTAAFVADPLLRWAFPDDALWPARAGAMFGHLFDTRVDGGEIRVSDDVAAVALWTPPGGSRLPEEEWNQSWARAAATFAPDELERWRQFVAIVNAVEPHEEHWYLGVLGTRPERQGEGLGRSVAQPILAEADAGAQPAYLETATEANLRFYARLGFDVRDDVVVPGGPRLWGLWREPRPLEA